MKKISGQAGETVDILAIGLLIAGFQPGNRSWARPNVRLAGCLARRDEAQPACCNEEQRSQAVRQMCNRACSALTRWVIVVDTNKRRIFSLLPIRGSGQLRFLARMLHKHCPGPSPRYGTYFFDFQAIAPPTPQRG